MAKATKKQALGRGLSALLKDPSNDISSVQDKNADKVIGSIVELDIESIEINPFQPRTNFNEETLLELASSIKELGVIQPITVRKLEFNKFQLVSGERRFRASKLIGLETIPAYIRIANDQESLEMALVENIQRQDLDPIEIALSYQRLIDEINLTQEQMSERVGKKRSTIANYLRLLKLDPIIQTGMRDGFITMGHGRAIINIEDQNIQLDIYEKIISNKLSVRDTESLVKSYQSDKTVKVPEKQEIPKYIKKGIKDFSEYFGHKINVKVSKNGKGNITIPFHSEEDFNRILKLIKSAK
ncbi:MULTISPECIES: ParB/RepB/Spo0J family partition protein [Xanthomarina]|jgi:ParB family chromosome partitioning protein|uniref:Chromosome (Plasmid) partitioning protein ParB n=1 Tax=Xanthomarina gelatinilytica TaxID=1137281 RepID=M7N852_9FLAO|nr:MULTISPECIES: ParB/RepB/Spo0J family partition protein [Xanthomarina]MCB0387823.1 ParB/RepB/Spo0J family partition protein [Winogradskyella sp.]EMQ94648.1 Chromosome (plasmid) partitioning protein ParB [Xanthomarina gelatinilytica]MAL22898.1 chromosome partitioning protein ParB [Xanthomarina sp.]MBF62752.1 chromosome partitioning protein ParB [Xanthomarina sp.]MDX1316233.1 ParB/RepB/Spo0J family partition protein [Xanthomarina gelatinilytica]|tara:strand:- start:4212 stop:5111 length:900 start_codon:yes stop_codon:yes gene_type:complete